MVREDGAAELERKSEKGCEKAQKSKGKWTLAKEGESDKIDSRIILKRAHEEIKEESCLNRKKGEVSIRSSAAEYLTYVASIGDQQDSIEIRYEDENI